MRERTGQIYENEKTGRWTVRVGYENHNGKRTALQRSAVSKTEAKKLLGELLTNVERGGRDAIEADKMTFNDLADYFESHYAKPAKFIDNRKVEGMRNVSRVKGFIKQFRPYFGKMRLARITYGDILAYRNMRLKVPTHYKGPRNIATMNRELSCLRRVFNIAIREGWLMRNPVNCGESLIDISAERRRDRILTLDEEKKLLMACAPTGRRPCLRAVVMLLLDTGARIGETLKLRFSDIDFERRLITFQAMNTKTLKERRVAMTARVYTELRLLHENRGKDGGALVFPTKSVGKAFESACREAGIETGRPFGITVHSLRHTAATRLVKGQMPIQMVGRILSHQNPQTTYRYLTANDETLYEAAKILENVQTSK